MNNVKKAFKVKAKMSGLRYADGGFFDPSLMQDPASKGAALSALSSTTTNAIGQNLSLQNGIAATTRQNAQNAMGLRQQAPMTPTPTAPYTPPPPTESAMSAPMSQPGLRSGNSFSDIGFANGGVVGAVKSVAQASLRPGASVDKISNTAIAGSDFIPHWDAYGDDSINITRVKSIQPQTKIRKKSSQNTTPTKRFKSDIKSRLHQRPNANHIAPVANTLNNVSYKSAELTGLCKVGIPAEVST